MSDLIQTVREALSKETPVPWETRTRDEWHEDYGDVLWWTFPIQEPPYCGSPLDNDWPNYHTHWTPIILPTNLIANAPEWLRQLCDQVESQEREIEWLRECLDIGSESRESAQQENTELRAEIERLKEERDSFQRVGIRTMEQRNAAVAALEWYADESNYEMIETRVNDYSTETTSATWQDSGERARQALSHIRP